MSLSVRILSAIIILTLFPSGYIYAISGEFSPPAYSSSRINQCMAQSANQEHLDWPQPAALHNVGSVEMTVTCDGCFGGANASIHIDPETNQPLSSFVFPPGSPLSYLWGGGIWIGGIIDGDTLVSMGMSDVFGGSAHFYPESDTGSVYLTGGPGDKQLAGSYIDTIPDPYWDAPPYEKLGSIKIKEVSRSWTYSPNDDFILFDFVVQNIGDQTIEDAFVGFYMDCDVSAATNGQGYFDDIAGYIESEAIAYICDNDGDPRNNNEWADSSITGAIGLKLIHSDPPAADTTFNWWNRFAPNFSPQYIGNPPQDIRYMADGELGNPVTAQDRYYLISNGAIDHDQLYTGVMNEDSGWVSPPGSGGSAIAGGCDTRFTFGFGPYLLPPGDSINIVVAFVAGHDIHQAPDDFNQYYSAVSPDDYFERLNFENLIENAQAAENLYNSDYELALRPGRVQGVRIDSENDVSARASWLPKSQEDIDGYNIYIRPVPDSQIIFDAEVFFYDDTIGMELLNTDRPVTDTTYLIENLIDGQTYFVSITAANFFSESAKSVPRYFTPGTPDAPITNPGPFYISDCEFAEVNWNASDNNDIDHFNIYRYVGPLEHSLRYKRRITTRPIDNREHDSLHMIIDGTDTTMYFLYDVQPYAQVAWPQTDFNDYITNSELYYYITAVDTSGQESDTSQAIVLFTSATPEKDFLIFLENTGDDRNFESIDTVKAYYERILNDYTVEYFILSDSAQGYYCDSEGNCYDVCIDKECFIWNSLAPFKYVILEENMLKPIVDRYDFIVPFNKILNDYINLGGTIIYFGNFANAIIPYGMDTATFSYSTGSKEFDLFGIDSVLTNGVGLHFNSVIGNGNDTVGGFIGATSLADPFEQLDVNLSYDWWNTQDLHNLFWPYSTPPMTAIMYPRTEAQSLYSYKSLFSQSSMFDGGICGVRNNVPPGQVYTFSFHPWYLDETQANRLFRIITGDISFSVDDPPNQLPDKFVLHQNFPNPFNPATTIKYSLPRAEKVTIDIFNILGRRISQIIDKKQPAGSHIAQWDGTNYRGENVATGLYFYRITAGENVETRKMLLLK